MKYRSEIDGLRALAVTSVIGYHAGFPGFIQGYLGVDIFFVISGYLITGILLGDIENGWKSVLNFYQRRIRRIFPALVVMLAITLTVGFAVDTPARLENLGAAGATTAISASNIFFWKSVDYFSQLSLQSPLLHTWSLAVEEQFYLFFPLLLLTTRLSQNLRFGLIVIFAFLSFILTFLMLQWKPSAAFYLLPTRAWELLAGALVSIYWRQDAATGGLRTGLANGGIVLMVSSVAGIFDLLAAPWLALPLSVAGAVAFIIGSEDSIALGTRVFRWAPVVLIGQASYSLYLWHQPILAYYDYLTLSQAGVIAKLILCLAAVVISFISLYAIERPFRKPRTARQGVLFAVGPAVAMVAVGFFSLWLYASGGAPSRLSPRDAALLDVELDKERHPLRCLNVEEVTITPDRPCFLGAVGSQPSALLWGDSHSMFTATALLAAASKAEASFAYVASVDCPIGLGFAIDGPTGPQFVSAPAYQYCKDYNEAMLVAAESNTRIRTVVLSSRWTNWRVGEKGTPSEGVVDIRLRDGQGVAGSLSENWPKFERGFLELIKKLEAIPHVERIVVVGPIADLPAKLPSATYLKEFGMASLELNIPTVDFAKRNARILQLFSQFMGGKITVVWPHTVFCDERWCRTVDDGKLLYFDDNHLSLYGALQIAPLLDVAFGHGD